LSRSIRRKNSAGDAGFTLVEALVSLALLAIVLASIGGLAASSSRSALHIERHLAEVETAQAVIAGLPDRKDLATGSLAGEMANHRWRVDAAPYAPGLAGASDWSPQQIVVRVESPAGALVRIDMIRLVRRAAQ